MSKYCHDDSIHHCLIKCEECSAYYADDESENWLITEKDQRDFIKEEIRIKAITEFAENLKEEIYKYLMEKCESHLSYIAITRFVNKLVSEYEREQKNE